MVDEKSEIDRVLERLPLDQPITELANKQTTNIDLSESGKQIVELLSQTDGEIFNGWAIGDDLRTLGIKDRLVLDKLARLSDLIRGREKIKIVMSGCGTSGRIAYLCSQTFNAFIGREVCECVIAGGDWALVNSVESVEDRPEAGEQELIKIIDHNEGAEFVYIGITCGLSAPFVAGQLSYCMDEMEQEGSRILASALIGFNPVEMARRTLPINKRQETFADLLSRMSVLEKRHPNRFFVLNPLIGPEPITGSSRMKSGTATKIMLDIMLTRASVLDRSIDLAEMVESYEAVMKEVVYSRMHEIGRMIDRAAKCIRTPGGSVNYLSDNERLGFIACVDASECVPTYGANREDIKGFFASTCDKWSGFLNTCQAVQPQNIFKNIDCFKTSSSLFILIENDGVMAGSPSRLIRDRLKSETGSQIIDLGLLKNTRDGPSDLDRVNFYMGSRGAHVNEYFAQCLEEFVLKLVLNAVSTGAHVLIGKTYENIMVDVRVSNVKLFYRAKGILRRLTGRSDEECEMCLLKSIHGDDLSGINRGDIDRHIEVGTGRKLVVPKALVMLFTNCSLQSSEDYLNLSGNSVRNCIYKLKNSQK